MPYYNETLKKALCRGFDGDFVAIPEVSLGDLPRSSARGCVIKRNSIKNSIFLFQKGLELIFRGECALIILSGGQATRLGIRFPKALLPVSPIKKKTLIQLHLERAKKVFDLGLTSILHPYVYILTSTFSQEQIKSYIMGNCYFGLDEKRIVFLTQENLPCFKFGTHDNFEYPRDLDRSISSCAESPCDSGVVVAPNGNGALFGCLANTPSFISKLDSMKWFHVISIDNCLSKPLDPELLGLASCAPPMTDVINKCIKMHKNEKLGVFCQGSYPCIVEYTELDRIRGCDILEKEGNIYGNICDHLFSAPFLKHVLSNEYYKELPYHAVEKAIPYWDSDINKPIQPKTPNGYKLELFIFDIFRFANRMLCLEVDRNDSFSPIKYACDCEESNIYSAQHKMSDMYKRWLNSVGCEVGEGFCEISPTLSYCGENLESYRNSAVKTPAYLE